MSYHVKKGDKIVVNSGRWKGEKATILAILPKKDRVVLELEDASKRELLGKRTVKKSKAYPNGGMVERSVSTHVSNVNKVAEAKAEK